MHSLTFNKLLYRTEDLLKIFPVSLSMLNRYSAELIANHREPTEMGRYNFKGCKYDLWDPAQLRAFMVKEKLNLKVKYDYEKAEQEKVKEAIIVTLNKNNKHLIGVNT